jgi:hypothetical protein
VQAEVATDEDVLLIEGFLAYQDSAVRRNAMEAAGRLGRNEILQPRILKIVLSVELKNDPQVAIKFVDAFRPAGSLILHTPGDVSNALGKLLLIGDFDVDHGTISRFLTALTTRFPEQVLDFLYARIEIEREHRLQGNWEYDSFHTGHGLSFEGLDEERIRSLVSRCLAATMGSDSPFDPYIRLFWIVGGSCDATFAVLAEFAAKADESQVARLFHLIQAAPAGLAFNRPDFARTVLRAVSGSNKQKAIDAFVMNAHSLRLGFRAGPSDALENEWKRFSESSEELLRDGDLRPLYNALRQTIFTDRLRGPQS